MKIVGLEDNQRFALMKFRKAVQDVTQPHHDDNFLLRWLRARKWDPVAAEKMLRDVSLFLHIYMFLHIYVHIHIIINAIHLYSFFFSF